MKKRTLGLLVGFLVSSAAQSATRSGTQLEWSVNTGIGHTDNISLVESDPVSQTIASAGGAIDFTREGSGLNVQLRGDGAFLSYLDDAYEDEFLGSAATTIRFGLLGDALTWTLDDTFGQTITDEFEPATPDNRGHVNVLSTGPELRLPMGSATDLVVGGRYESSSYESANNVDSHSWVGDAAVVRRVSPAVAWSLNATVSRVVYDDTASFSYNKQELFSQFKATGARQTLTADLGIGFLDQAGQTDSSPLFRVNWTRRLTPSWSLALDAGSEYLNAADQFVGGVARGVVDGAELGGTQDIILTDQAQRNDSAALSLAFERPRTTLRFFSEVRQERFPGADTLDRDKWSVGAEASRRITQRLQAFIGASYESRDYGNSNEDDNTTIVNARADWRLGRVLFLGLGGDIQRRSGNTGFNYDENVYKATLTYRPSGR